MVDLEGGIVINMCGETPAALIGLARMPGLAVAAGVTTVTTDLAESYP
jgi:hypothetical protein